VRLTTSLQVGAKYFGCVVCRFHVAAGAEAAPQRRHKQILWSHRQSQLESTFRSGFFLLLVDKTLVSQSRETSRCAHHTFLTANKHFSGAVAEEKEDFCKGSLLLPIFYFVVVLLTFFTLFCLHLFIKNTKNSSFIVVIFTCLLLVLLE
jgi:hypothetical protein